MGIDGKDERDLLGIINFVGCLTYLTDRLISLPTASSVAPQDENLFLSERMGQLQVSTENSL